MHGTQAGRVNGWTDSLPRPLSAPFPSVHIGAPYFYLVTIMPYSCLAWVCACSLCVLTYLGVGHEEDERQALDTGQLVHLLEVLLQILHLEPRRDGQLLDLHAADEGGESCEALLAAAAHPDEHGVARRVGQNAADARHVLHRLGGEGEEGGVRWEGGERGKLREGAYGLISPI